MISIYHHPHHHQNHHIRAIIEKDAEIVRLQSENQSLRQIAREQGNIYIWRGEGGPHYPYLTHQLFVQ